MSKGFTHVLEGIMAAFLLIGTVTTIVPQIEYDASDGTPADRIRTRLAVLDHTDELSDNLTTDEIKSRITEQITSSYSFGVTKLTVDSETNSFDVNSGSQTKSYNVNGESFEAQIFLNSAGNVNVSYDGQMLLNQESETGYHFRPLENGTGDMQVNGTGNIDVAIRGYTFDDGDRPFETVTSVKYVQTQNRSSQIGVFLWQPDRP